MKNTITLMLLVSAAVIAWAQSPPVTPTQQCDIVITGAKQICISNACSLQVMPVVSATWTAYDLANSNAVVATGSGIVFTHTFSHKGRYLITAAHPDYCTEATFVLEVKDTPPAPTVTDLDPHNRHTACLNGGIALDGTPSEPNYNLVWHPACTTATPQYYNGDSVTIMYQNEVCDVYVYNYDRVLQCQSTDYYVHTMEMLKPEKLKITHDTTVVPGTLLVFGNDEVPDQSREGMLYEWSIQENRQRFASVQGSHIASSITLAVNEAQWPDRFYVKLERRFCGFKTKDYIVITVDSMAHDSPEATPWRKTGGKHSRRRANCEATADSRDVTITSGNKNQHRCCDNTPVKLTATLNDAEKIESAYWDFGDGSFIHAYGDSVYHTFATPMLYDVRVTVIDDRGCKTTNKAPFHIVAFSNPYNYASMAMMEPEVRPGDFKEIVFSPALGGAHYTWWRQKDSARVSATATFSINQPDNYFVHVVDYNGCHKQVSSFVPFLNIIKSDLFDATEKESDNNVNSIK